MAFPFYWTDGAIRSDDAEITCYDVSSGLQASGIRGNFTARQGFPYRNALTSPDHLMHDQTVAFRREFLQLAQAILPDAFEHLSAPTCGSAANGRHENDRWRRGS